MSRLDEIEDRMVAASCNSVRRRVLYDDLPWLISEIRKTQARVLSLEAACREFCDVDAYTAVSSSNTGLIAAILGVQEALAGVPGAGDASQL